MHETESINYEDGEPAIGEVKMTTSRKTIGIFSIAAIVAIGALTLTSGVASAGVINMPDEYTMIRDASAYAPVAHVPAGSWSFDGTLVTPFSDQWKANFQIGDFMANFRRMRAARKPAMSTTLWQQEQPQTSGASRAALGSWGDTYHVPGGYPTIQQAIDNATGGETILVEPGRYNETVAVTVSHIVIKANSTNPADTVVSATGTDDHVITITNQTNVTLVGFTIQDARGTSQDVAGIYMNTTSECTITNNVIMNISTAGSYDAYGVLAETAVNLTCTDTTVRDIHGNNNSIGILIEEGMNIDFDPTLTENITASNGAAFGLLIEAINLSFTDTAVHNITGYSFAYGILLFAENVSFGTMVIERVNASSAAYGILMERITDGNFTDTTIRDITGSSLALGLYTMHAENVSFGTMIIERVTATTVSGIFAVDVIWTEGRFTDNTTIIDGRFTDTTVRDIAGDFMAYGIFLVAENVSFNHTVIERVNSSNGQVSGIQAGIQNISFTDTTVHNITGDTGAIGIGLVAEKVSFNHTVVEQVTASSSFAYGTFMLNITDGSFIDSTISNITGSGFWIAPSPAGMYILTYAKNVSFNHTVIEHVTALAPDAGACGLGFDSIQNGSFTDTTIRDITGNSFAYGIYLMLAENVSFDSTIIERINAPNGQAFGICVYNIPHILQNGSFVDTTINDIAGYTQAFGIYMVAENVSFDPTVIERVSAPSGSAHGIYVYIQNGSFTDTTVRDIIGRRASGVFTGIQNGSFTDTTIHNITGDSDEYDAIGVFMLYMRNGSFTNTTISDIEGNSDFVIGIFGYFNFINSSFLDTTIRDVNGNESAIGIAILSGLHGVAAAVNVTFDYTVIERVNARSAFAAGFFSSITDGRFTDTAISDIAGNSSAYGICMGGTANVTLDPTVIERVNASNGEAYGIFIQTYAMNANFSGGNITNCGHGFWVENGQYNRIEGFTIRDNTLSDTGVHLENVSNTTICRNCFYNNVLQAWDNGTNNNWDGNYWSDWNGTGPYNISGSAGSQDSSPLDECPLKEVPPQVQVPVATSVGLIALAGLLSTIAAVTITRRKRR